MDNKMNYYININNDIDNDQYGWIYLGLKVNLNTITVYEEITGHGYDIKYLNLSGYELPKLDLKEITKDDYELIKYNLFNNEDIEEVYKLTDKIIKGEN